MNEARPAWGDTPWSTPTAICYGWLPLVRKEKNEKPLYTFG
jgi:hypothetical protein